MNTPNRPARRGFIAGAAAIGAAAAAVATLPSQLPTAPAADAGEPKPPEKGGGYRLSEHVQRYYKTTRI